MTFRELQNQLLELKRSYASNSVAAALMSLQQELAKPPPVFDPYRALAGLESLVNLARDKADARTKRFNTILHQCRPLLGNLHFQSIPLRLVGDKEDVEVAKAIQKSLRPSASLWPHVPTPTKYSSAGPPISGIVHVPRSLPVSVAAKGVISLDSALGIDMFTCWWFTFS